MQPLFHLLRIHFTLIKTHHLTAHFPSNPERKPDPGPSPCKMIEIKTCRVRAKIFSSSSTCPRSLSPQHFLTITNNLPLLLNPFDLKKVNLTTALHFNPPLLPHTLSLCSPSGLHATYDGGSEWGHVEPLMKCSKRRIERKKIMIPTPYLYTHINTGC